MTHSQLYKTDAINLKSYPLKESDKIMVMYSKEKGLIRSEGKDYVFRDGDVVVIRFNV